LLSDVFDVSIATVKDAAGTVIQGILGSVDEVRPEDASDSTANSGVQTIDITSLVRVQYHFHLTKEISQRQISASTGLG
jgi:hypothetical protein